MTLGQKVYFFEDDVSIRKGTITSVIEEEKYVDYLSSNPYKTLKKITYIVCAVKGGDFRFFGTDLVFETINDIKKHLADISFNNYNIYE